MCLSATFVLFLGVEYSLIQIMWVYLCSLIFFVLYCRSILYLEGNLETKVFSDPITGLVRHIREIAIRRGGMCPFFCSVQVLRLNLVRLNLHNAASSCSDLSFSSPVPDFLLKKMVQERLLKV